MIRMSRTSGSSVGVPLPFVALVALNAARMSTRSPARIVVSRPWILSIGIWIARSRFVSRLRIGSAVAAKSATVICWPGSSSRTATLPAICDACVTAPGRMFSSATALGLEELVRDDLRGRRSARDQPVGDQHGRRGEARVHVILVLVDEHEQDEPGERCRGRRDGVRAAARRDELLERVGSSTASLRLARPLLECLHRRAPHFVMTATQPPIVSGSHSSSPAPPVLGATYEMK